eukprot:TRINITY_DN5086_c0_g4_i1.p1 TRINITY_DN5086_c0_g4~~TRINITY_DN5086_c0_g4_i1.p1  ORF type:complete len:411 (-),score=82.72 TRINITY_DN5086_c0_g4_i1:749-1981(-)
MKKLEPITASPRPIKLLNSLQVTPFTDTKRTYSANAHYVPQSNLLKHTPRLKTHYTRIGFYSTRCLAETTKEENKVIEKKLQEYESFVKKRNVIEQLRTANYTSYEDVHKKIDNVTFKINSLLYSQAPVKALISHTEVNATLSAGLKCHYEIAVKKQLMPLQLKLISDRKAVNLILCFSNKIRRPSREDCDKMMIVKSQIAYLLFRNDSKSKYFQDKALYLTLESDKELACTLSVWFGRKDPLKVAKPLANANVSTDEPEDNQEDDIFISPRRSKILRIRPYTKKTKREILEVKKHRDEVVCLGKKKDNEKLCRKFLSCHRTQLKERLAEIIERELKRLKGVRKAIGYWAVMVKIVKTAKTGYDRFVRLKKKRAADTLRLYRAMRIYMFIKANLSIDSSGFKDRVYQKII